MAESMTVQTLSYVADVLKFVAVPFAVMEVLGPDQRKRIENAIIKRTKFLWWYALYLSLPTFVGLHILVLSASHLVFLFFVVAIILFPVFQLIAVAYAKTETLLIFEFLRTAAVLLILVGALIAWLLPYWALTGFFYPVEWGLALLRRSVNTFWAPVVPAFDARGIISAYRNLVADVQAYIYGWWGMKIFASCISWPAMAWCLLSCCAS